jgi:hypothetical protein
MRHATRQPGTVTSDYNHSLLSLDIHAPSPPDCVPDPALTKMSTTIPSTVLGVLVLFTSIQVCAAPIEQE